MFGAHNTDISFLLQSSCSRGLRVFSNFLKLDDSSPVASKEEAVRTVAAIKSIDIGKIDINFMVCAACSSPYDDDKRTFDVVISF